MATGFGFWWYCTVVQSSLVLGVLMWEVFHDIQYTALVWGFQRHRVDGSADTSAAERWLFSPGRIRVAGYLLLVLAYGGIGIVTSFAGIQLPENLADVSNAPRWLLRITLVSALLHFYYDGFIWKIRELKVRRDLGLREYLAASPGSSSEARLHSRLEWPWLFFFIAVFGMGIRQYRNGLPDFASQMENLANAIPDCWTAEFMAGTHSKGLGELHMAEGFYRQAIQSRPDLAIGHLFLADILYKQDRIVESLEQYRLTVESDSGSLEARRNLAHLYLKTNNPRLASEQFQCALKLAPDDPDLNFGMATSLLRQNRWREAESFARMTLRLLPTHSGACNILGMIRDVQGDTKSALRYYNQALESDSANASARENLAAAKRNLQPESGSTLP
jgi:tetratricopeptide (TPR) repeat protein